MSEHTVTIPIEVTYDYTPGSTPQDRDVQPDPAEVDCIFVVLGGKKLDYCEVTDDALRAYILDTHENETPDRQEMRA